MTPNMTRQTPPMIATRMASCGVIGPRRSSGLRYITALAPYLEPAQAERAGLDRVRAALHAGGGVDGEHRPQHAPHEREERQGDRDVQEHGDDRLAQHERAHPRADLEHEADG